MSRVAKLKEAEHFARRLQAELDQKRWTAQDLVRALGGSPMPYKWLKGFTAPRVDTKRRLADALGISMMAFEPTPTNGQATRDEGTTAALQASRPIMEPPESSAAEIELVQGGPLQSVKVHLKLDAIVTLNVASAVIRALEGK
jgi:transcriptional regulator with XRE-family HTH domain